jgi:hypothetical protein
MAVDEQVCRVLGDMSRDLRPQPDPHGRVLARHRRGRRRRAAVVGLGMAVVVAVAGPTVAGPALTGGPDPSRLSESDRLQQNFLSWSERLVESPPRGALGANTEYVDALSDTLLATQRRGELRLKTPVRAAKVLFVDDVGAHRIALAAFVRAEPDPGTGWPSAAVWMVARKGASAQELGSPPALGSESDGLDPYESFTVSGDEKKPGPVAHVAIAPDGCGFETAALPAVTDWKPEPSGSYVVRTSQTLRPEWWRVSCDGVLRKTLPGPGWPVPQGITDVQFERAMSRVRGKVDSKRSRDQVWQSAQGWGYAVTDLPTVVWNGRTSGTSPSRGVSFDGRAVVLAAPQPGGGWAGEVNIEYDTTGTDGVRGTGASFSLRTDPSDPSAVLAIRLGQETSTLLVVTPVAAITVRAVKDGQEVARAQVRDAGAVLTVPRTAGVVVEALDVGGIVIGTGGIAAENGRSVGVDRWDED